MDEVPLIWKQRALLAVNAENWAENEQMEQARIRACMGSR